MANKTYTFQRSDLYPVGTVVKAFPAASHIRGAAPAAASVAQATVDAAGKLAISLPAGQPFVLWAEVAGVHQNLRVGDPSQPEVTNVSSGTLADRRRRRRAIIGV